MEHSVRRITRSRSDRVFAGVCGGLAAYLGLDPVLIRVLYIALTILSWAGPGILLYILAWITIPLDREETVPTERSRIQPVRNDTRRIAGIFLVIIGLLALLSASFGWFHVLSDLRLAGPLLLLAIGAALLLWRKDTAKVPASGSQEPPVSDATASAPPSGSSFTTAAPLRLTRSEIGRKIAGVCSGLGEYFNLDPTILRLLFIAAIFAGGAGIILYVIMWLVVPLKHELTVPRIGS